MAKSKKSADTKTKTELQSNEGVTQNVGNAIQGETDSGQGNIGQIRNILFGNQMQEYDRRFSKLEHHLQKETGQLSNRLDNRFTDLEKLIQSEMDGVEVQRLQDQDVTDKEFNQIRDTIDATANQLESGIEKLQQETQQKLLQLHQDFNKEIQALSDQIHRKMADDMAVIQNKISSLDDRKANRRSLAELFLYISQQLDDTVASTANISLNSSKKKAP